MNRITIDLQNNIYTELKLLAAKRNCSLSNIVRQCIIDRIMREKIIDIGEENDIAISNIKSVDFSTYR